MTKTELASPEHWARQTLNLFRSRPDVPEIYSWQHTAAAAGHRWKWYEHHAGTPIVLTKEDYLAALEAAESNKIHSPAIGQITFKE